MTDLNACPTCGAARPANRTGTEPWCCSLACYRSFHDIDQPEDSSCHGSWVRTTTSADTPLRHDGVTMDCPVCQRSFAPVGRQRYCSDACRAAAYRQRRGAGQASVVVPTGQQHKTITVYECDGCGARAVGEQRCEGCQTFMRRVGIGGSCPSCDEPVSVEDLLGQDVTIETAGRPSRHRRA